MALRFSRQTLRRAIIAAATLGSFVVVAVDAQQGQATAQAPLQSTPAQQTPPPAGRSNAAAQGAVRDASGAIIGFTALAEIPGTPWRIHDAARPHPRVITPGATTGGAPSDTLLASSSLGRPDVKPWRVNRTSAEATPSQALNARCSA